MKIIDEELLDKLTKTASESERLRKNHNFHVSLSDPINRMLNAFEPNTYCPPHKHENPDKREIFIILRGRIAVIFFDEHGVIKQTIIGGEDTGIYGVEVAPREWHSVVSLKSGTVVYEIKDGPYKVEDDKNFAPWAPPENSQESIKYLQNIIDQCKLTVE